MFYINLVTRDTFYIFLQKRNILQGQGLLTAPKKHSCKLHDEVAYLVLTSTLALLLPFGGNHKQLEILATRS